MLPTSQPDCVILPTEHAQSNRQARLPIPAADAFVVAPSHLTTHPMNRSSPLALACTALLFFGACTTSDDAALSPAATEQPAATESEAYDESLLVFDESEWEIVNDGVMGGDSQGAVAVEGGALVFTGTLVTQGGGFTSTRTEIDADLSSFEGVEMRVRGGGRTFEVELDDDRAMRGREASWRAPFDTSEDWATVRVPFSDLRATVMGESVQAERIDPENLRSMGFYILDGVDGPFRLEVDYVRAYR